MYFLYHSIYVCYLHLTANLYLLDGAERPKIEKYNDLPNIPNIQFTCYGQQPFSFSKSLSENVFIILVIKPTRQNVYCEYYGTNKKSVKNVFSAHSSIHNQYAAIVKNRFEIMLKATMSGKMCTYINIS